MEFKQGIFGEYNFWYNRLKTNSLKKNILEKCLDSDSLMSRHINIKDRICALNSVHEMDGYLLAEEKELDKWGELTKVGDYKRTNNYA